LIVMLSLKTIFRFKVSMAWLDKTIIGNAKFYFLELSFLSFFIIYLISMYIIVHNM
jgi:hypothetical protein